MSFTQVAPIVAACAALGFALFRATTRRPATSRGCWWPAGVSAAFLTFSLGAMFREGALGFWTEHVRNLWGNQIWFDLLIAASVALFLLIPRARKVGLTPVPWVLFALATGGIGLLAFLAVVLRREASWHPDASHDAKMTRAHDGDLR